MKRLVLCFDGTWNALTDPTALTNVVKLANMVTVSSGAVNQISYYNSGVGSGGPIDRFIGGAFGVGLKSNVKRGLAFLSLNYEEGDEIYLFGFSRGAYTARALAGVIGAAGIPINIGRTEIHWNHYQEIAKLRPKPGLPKNSPKRIAADAAIAEVRKKLVPLSRNTDEKGEWVPVKITCVGVWDTVGAYGIPSGMGLGALPHLFTYWTRGFRDTHFGSTVDLGLHAVAIDERRRPFMPTFWTRRPRLAPDPKLKVVEESEQPPKVEQVWFPGVHSNVGGGYASCGLSDLALGWMMAQVQEKTGLRFNEGEALKTLWPCPACTLYTTSRGGWFNPPRAILPEMPEAAGAWAYIKTLLGWRQRRRALRLNEKVHWSVRERRNWTATLFDKGAPRKYSPANLGAKVKEYAEPLEFERKLLNRTARSWADHCPMEKAKQPCQCAARDLKTLSQETAHPAQEASPQPRVPTVAA